MRHLEAFRMISKILFIVNVTKSYAHKTLFRCRYSNVPTTCIMGLIVKDTYKDREQKGKK